MMSNPPGIASVSANFPEEGMKVTKIMYALISKLPAIPIQDTILSSLSGNLPAEGLYMMPMADPNSPDFKTQQEKLEKKRHGNPWAMVFYHPNMEEFSAQSLVMGVVYAFIGALIVAFAIYTGKFPSFWSRFTVSMLCAVFTLVQGVLSNMNWWSFPWDFIQPQVPDLIIGWGLCSVWLGWYVKKADVSDG